MTFCCASWRLSSYSVRQISATAKRSLYRLRLVPNHIYLLQDTRKPQKVSTGVDTIDQIATHSVTGQDYRDAMSQFAGAVHAVTTDGPSGLRGATVTAATSVTDNPPTVLVCINNTNPRNSAFLENGVFAINTLKEQHLDLSRALAGEGGLSVEDRFALGSWCDLETGAPVLEDALASFDCRLVKSVEFGTHTILIGKVAALQIGNGGRPLLYHDRGYRVL